jgi:hypothetical protein
MTEIEIERQMRETNKRNIRRHHNRLMEASEYGGRNSLEYGGRQSLKELNQLKKRKQKQQNYNKSVSPYFITNQINPFTDTLEFISKSSDHKFYSKPKTSGEKASDLRQQSLPTEIESEARRRRKQKGFSMGGMADYIKDLL